MASDRICPDGHRCSNGSLCTPHPYDEGAYYCDCDADFLNDGYAGLSCEHARTSVCEFNQEVSSVSFCTNGGTCRVEANAEEAQLGCICLEGYVGDQCQFVEGQKVPENHPLYGSNFQDEFNRSGSSGGGGMETGIVVVIVLIVLGVVGGMGYVVYRKRKQSKDPRPAKKGAAADMVLDADGGVLKEAVRASAHNVGSLHGDDVFFDSEANGKATTVVQSAVMEEVSISETKDSTLPDHESITTNGSAEEVSKDKEDDEHTPEIV